MGQLDVLNFLQEQRKISDDWHTVRTIQEGLKNKGFGNGTIKGVWDDLYKLACFNYIQVRGVGLWKHHKEFRACKIVKKSEK